MADRVLNEEPPTPNHRQVGWHCIYHEQSSGGICHNPLDCDLVPRWVLTVKEAHRQMYESRSAVSGGAPPVESAPIGPETSQGGTP